MKSKWQRGDSNLEGIIILVVLGIIMITSVSGSNKESSGDTFGWTTGTTISSADSDSDGGGTVSGTPVATSDYKNNVWIGSGNASYVYQSYEEYITVENHGSSPINITGWQLRNGKDKRPYYIGSTLQRFSADIAVIPQASLVLSPKGNSFPQDVILEDGEKAIVTTGSIGVRSPYAITSFKENMCTGYIEALPDYAFNPPLNQNCPQPSNEAGMEGLEPDCRNFIKTLSSCRTPEFNIKDRDGYPCSTCVNGQMLTSQCAAFIKEHYNYQGCLLYHGSDKNFSGRTWRVFLGRGWEMWAKEYETIEIFDSLGKLVNFQNY